MTRAAVVVAGLVVAAFFGLAVRQSTALRDATQRLDGSRADGRTAALLHRAGVLNPDSTVDIQRARLAVLDHDLPRARRILLGIVGREPENAVAWATIRFVFVRSDRALSHRAAARLRALVPAVPEA